MKRVFAILVALSFALPAAAGVPRLYNENVSATGTATLVAFGLTACSVSIRSASGSANAAWVEFGESTVVATAVDKEANMHVIIGGVENFSFNISEAPSHVSVLADASGTATVHVKAKAC